MNVYLPVDNFFFFISFNLFLLLFAFWFTILLPKGLKLSDELNNPDRFIGESAWYYLRNLTEIGPRVAGSYENEKLAVTVIMDQLRNITKSSNRYQQIEIDKQSVSGAFPLEFLDGFTNVYNDVQNIIVRVISKNVNKSNPHYNLLLNCHFDTFIDSPGASDDAAGCALMLELLRVITKSNFTLKNHLVFLFNGAEENFMQASHGFITKHKWAKNIKAFLNFGACGAGGRELLFQAGPNNAWMSHLYWTTVLEPFASSIAEEIFQSSLIPSDTDYRIFRDFGNLSGFDFAWILNGYVYHTKLDTIDQMPIDSLQNTGNNMLPLIKAIVNSNMLEEEIIRDEKLIFFDFVGFSMLGASTSICNSIIIVLLYCSEFSYKSLRQYFNRNFPPILCKTGILISWLSIIAVNRLISIFLTNVKRTMSWYRSPLWIMFIYVCPAFLTMAFVTYYFNKLFCRNANRFSIFLTYYHCNQRFMEFILICGIFLGSRSVILPAFWMFFTILINTQIKTFDDEYTPKWVVIYISMLSMPLLQSYYIIVTMFQLVIPLMGRFGAVMNSETIIGFLTGICCCSVFSFTVPLILLVRKPRRIFVTFSLVYIVAINFLLFTDFGFPYSGNPSHLAPQRYILIHCNRIVHGNYEVKLNKTGYWIVNMDMNSPEYLLKYLPNISHVENLIKDCDKYLYCALPYIVSIKSLFSKTHWIPIYDDPVIINRSTLKIHKKIYSKRNCHIELEVNGPDHFQVMLSPFEFLVLKNWSIVDSKPLSGPKWKNRETYFIYHSYTRNPVPLIFTMNIEIPGDYIGQVAEIAVGSHILHGQQKTSKNFQKFLDKFPKWTTTSGWTATYESWII